METLLSLEATQGFGYSQVWAGRSRSGQLFVGDENGGQRCPLRVDDLQLEHYSSAPVRFLYGGRLIGATIQDATGYPNACTAVNLPPGMLGHAFARCGVSGALFAFDAHRVYATLGSCAAG
jgi:hypothetical protein